LLGKLRKAKESTMSKRSRTCEPNLFYWVIEFYGNALCIYIPLS
jgi:hypothetical protein